MKKVLGILAALLFAAVVIATGVFLFNKSQTKPVVYQTASPSTSDIVRKTVATGAVVPRKEVQIKPVSLRKAAIHSHLAPPYAYSVTLSIFRRLQPSVAGRQGIGHRGPFRQLQRVLCSAARPHTDHHCDVKQLPAVTHRPAPRA